MRSIFLYLACLMFGRLCFGQVECAELVKQRASTDASAALDKIINRVGFSPGSILVFTSSDKAVRVRGGAMSLTCPAGNGYERWIVYDPGLIKPPARDFVFAHEIAHHVNSQLISGSTWSQEDELQADYNGAQYLVRLRWTREQLSNALDQLNPSQGQGYPSLQERKANVAQAYADESAYFAMPGSGIETTPSTRVDTPLKQRIDQGRPGTQLTYGQNILDSQIEATLLRALAGGAGAWGPED